MFAVVAMENTNNNALVSSSNQSAKSMDIAALTNENAELKRKIAALESDVSSLTEQHQSLQSLIVSKTKQVKDYRDQISRQEALVKEAQGKLQLNVQQTGAALLLLEEEASVCREDKDKAERQAETLGAENEALRRENAALLERISRGAGPAAPDHQFSCCKYSYPKHLSNCNSFHLILMLKYFICT